MAIVAPSASADTGPITLPGTGFYAIVADAHGHVFVSEGQGSSALIVLGVDGSLVTTLPQAGASGLTLSPDGTTLYVADADGTQITAFDTATLAVKTTYPTMAHSCPREVAVLGQTLWFTDACATAAAVLDSVPVAGGPAENHPFGNVSDPMLRTVPGDDSTLIMVDGRGSTGTTIIRLDVSGEPTFTQSPFDPAGTEFPHDAAATPDGKYLVLAGDYPTNEHMVVSLSDFSTQPAYPTGVSPSAAAITPVAGGLLAAGSGAVAPGDPGPRNTVFVFHLGQPVPVSSIDAGNIAPAGLAWSPTGDRLYAVNNLYNSVHPTLTVLDDPAHLRTQLSASAVPAPVALGGSLSVTGDLHLDGQAAAGQTISVTRTDESGTSPLGEVQTDGTGHYALPDTPSLPGTITYSVTWAGDGTHPPGQATASSTVVVWHVPPAPTGISAVGGAGFVDVGFTPPPLVRDTPILSYTLYRGSAPDQLAPIETGLSESIPVRDSAPVIGTLEYYAVSASNVVGEGALGGAVAAAAWSPAWTGTFASVRPFRLLDTRYGVGAPRASIGAGQSIHLKVTGRGDLASAGTVPSDATAVVMNLTGTGATASTYLSAYPTGQPRPVASSLPLMPGSARANLVTVAIGSGGMVDVFNSSGHTDVVADLVGYYADSKIGAPVVQGAFHPQVPVRILDTRGSTPARPNVAVFVQVETPGNQTQVAAVLVTVTAVNPGAAGYLTAWDGSGTLPATSTVNFRAHENTANAAIVKLRDFGATTARAFSIVNSSALPADVIVDLHGWYDNDVSAPGGLRFHALTPTRIVDSRVSLGMPSAGPASMQVVPLPAGIGSSRTAAIITNVTAVGPTCSTYLTLWTAGGARPATSDVSASPAVNTAGMAVPSLASGSRAFGVYNFCGRTDLVIDVTGYFDANLPLTALAGANAAAAPQVRP